MAIASSCGEIAIPALVQGEELLHQTLHPDGQRFQPCENPRCIQGAGGADDGPNPLATGRYELVKRRKVSIDGGDRDVSPPSDVLPAGPDDALLRMKLD